MTTMKRISSVFAVMAIIVCCSCGGGTKPNPENRTYENAYKSSSTATETETDAKKLIEHLRKNNLGRASFLPISSVHGKKIEKVNSNGIDGVIGIAADLVKADKKYQDIILNLLGRTVIVEKETLTCISSA